jgi:hypothetical protein
MVRPLHKFIVGGPMVNKILIFIVSVYGTNVLADEITYYCTQGSFAYQGNQYAYQCNCTPSAPDPSWFPNQNQGSNCYNRLLNSCDEGTFSRQGIQYAYQCGCSARSPDSSWWPAPWQGPTCFQTILPSTCNQGSFVYQGTNYGYQCGCGSAPDSSWWAAPWQGQNCFQTYRPVPNFSHSKMVFNDDFNTLNLINKTTNPNGTWNVLPPWLIPFQQGGLTLSYLADPSATLPQNVVINPFSVVVDPTEPGNKLQIQAKPLPSNISNYLSTLYSRLLDPFQQNLAYSTGMISTFKSFPFQYGYVEARLKLPKGAGLWPTFWLVAENQIWPPEIDIFEVLGTDTSHLHFSVHTTDASLAQGHSSAAITSKLAVPDLSEGYHVIGMNWTAQRITLYVDGAWFAEYDTPSDMHQKMYVILHMDVGSASSGNWPGAPTDPSVFPASMLIDYLRVFEVQ